MISSGNETELLRAVLERVGVSLEFYSLRLSYSVDIADNSYTVSVTDRDFDLSGVLARLRRYTEFESILTDIVTARNDTERNKAIQRGRCLLDNRGLRAVE